MYLAHKGSKTLSVVYLEKLFCCPLKHHVPERRKEGSYSTEHFG